MKHYPFFVVAAILAGCSTVQPLSDVPKDGNLFITRSNEFAGGACTHHLYINNNKISTPIKRGQTVILSLPEGNHILRARMECPFSVEKDVAGNVQGYPITIGKSILRLSLAHEGAAKMLIPIVGGFYEPELNFDKLE